jgi:hypothetical protein
MIEPPDPVPRCQEPPQLTTPPQESKQDVVELKGDEPDAVAAIILYMYTNRHDNLRDDDWRFQLEVGKTADKYDLPVLSKAAYGKYNKYAAGLLDPEEVFSAIMHIRENAITPETLAIAEQLEKQHILALLKTPSFRTHTTQDTASMWKHMDMLVDFKLSLVNANIQVCTKCERLARGLRCSCAQ